MNPLQVAIIGSGPSGFYAAEELLSQQNLKVSVDMFEALPTPYGLVRGGVAPDHQKIKTVTKVYEKTAARAGFRFFGNVTFGKDLFLKDLQKHYAAVIFAVGAKSDRKMEIPGEELAGSFSATQFVGFYNGHPEYRSLQFDLSCQAVAVVGIGNVAIDVTRILATNTDELAKTDIAEYALAALKKSKVKKIYLLGRRGPAQAAFTNQEIRELCELPGADLVVDPKEVELDELSKEDLLNGVGGVIAKNNVQILAEHSQKGTGNQDKKIILRFLVSPVELLGENGKVTAIKLEKNQLVRGNDKALKPKGTGQTETLPVGLVFRSVGYKGVPLPGLPYDERKGILPNQAGRVVDPITKKQIPGLYVVGWAKRGPTGVIGTNKPDSIETVKKLLEDFSSTPSTKSEDILATLQSKNIRYVTFEEWKKLDAIEIETGKSKGKVREKFTTIEEMLSALDGNPHSTHSPLRRGVSEGRDV